MGKRKQGAPQKVDGRLRKELTWNMLDRNTEDEPLNILQDNDPELLDELQNIADIHLPKKQQKLTENDPKQLQSRPSTSDFSLSYNKDDLVDIFNLYVKKSSCKFNLYKDLTIRKGSHSFELAKFDISLLPFPLFFPLPSDGWSEVESFVVHISEEEDKHVISYGAGENRTKVVKNSAKKFNKNNAEKNVKFWLFCTQIPKEVLQSLKCKSLHVSVDSVDIEHSCMTIKVSGTEDFQNQTRYPSDPVRPRLMNESLKVLMDHFYSVAAPLIKDNHERCPLQHLPDVQHKDLLPRLRPYQQQAITWMVNQELRAKNLTSSGGILGDEMGLGKTVEVLGCMLHHPREHVPQPAPLPVVEDNEVEDVTDKKKKKKKRKKKRIVPMESEGSDSDETVIYMDLDTDISSLNLTEKDIDKNKENKVEIDQASNQSSGRYESCDSGILQTAVEDQSNVPNISGDSPTLEDSKHGVSLKSGKQKNNVKSGLEQTDKQNVKKSTEPKERKSCSSRIEKPDNDDMKNEPKHHHKNIFTEQPAYHKSKFECVCGAHRFQSGKKWQRLHPVQCMVCRLWQHAECVKYDVKDPLRGEFKCPHCHAAGEPIPSGATLIISPASIAHQWVDEIMKHVAQKAISVMMYEGVGMSKQQYVQPRTLARQDIVITTYETLRKELDYVDLPHSNSADGRKLRHPKRFMAIPSPLTAVQWWRTAMMALRLSGVNRWCVTGTPIQKGLEDLVGLFLFLGVEPYYHLQWWHQLLYDPYCHGVMEPMHNLLTSVLWRTVKKDVLDQIDIPEQRQEVTWLNFSPVEEHFYRRQHQVSARLSMQTLSKWSDSSVKLSSLDRKTVSQMLFPLVRLRQACCHPQVVRGEFLPLKKDVMTMDELLESLTKKAKLEAEEAHRQLVAAMNGQAGLHIIQDEYGDAVEKYREVLRSVEEHRDMLKTDGLQQLHAILHSLRALQYAMHTSMSEMKDAYKELNAAMTTLKGDPSQDLINKTVECCLRPIAEVLNKDTVRLGPDVGGFKANREGTWADSDAEKALKSILSFAKSYGGELVEYGTSHLKYLESLKKEYKKLRANWAGKKEHVATFDELDMCTTRLRLRLPDEPEPEIPQPNVLDRTELAQHGMKLMSDRIMANGELRRKLGQLIYLTNLAKNHVNIQDGSNPEPCPICQQELGKNWSVMQCGHCFCMDCMRILQERASFGRQNFCVKCAICRQSTHQTEISYVVTSQKYEHDELKVKENPEDTILLLPVHSGANGLNLIEATHNTIEQKMYTLLKSIDVTPSMGKASEEMSLTIGDISALFSQQMEAVDREGVASPQTDDSGGLGEDTGQGSSQDIGQWLGQDADQGSSQDIGQGLGEDRGQGSSQDIDQGLEEETGRDIGQGLGEYTGQGSSQDIGQGLEADKGQESSHDK
ncbi:SHPRH-like protein, partial [Mya arenaria]